MEEKSAYEQLEYLHEQTNLEHYCYQSSAFGHVMIHQFNNMTQNKTFLQIQEYEINTQIATADLPTPINLYPEIISNENIKQIFAKHPNVNIYAFKHCSLTVSVSYLRFLDVFAITHQQNTKFYKMNQHFQENTQQDRLEEVAQCFFVILNQLSQNAIDCLKQDIENRSIIGMYCYKWILWVGIVDHYGKQYLHHPEFTKKFLSHYGLQLVQVISHLNVNYENFEKIYYQTRNDYLFDYNDMDKGTTLYLWDDQNFIQCYYISHKHYEILEDFKSSVRDKRFNISQQLVKFLSKYDLSLYEMEFYKKYIQKFCDFPPQPKVTFSTLTSQIFNSILLNKNRCTRKLEHRYSLAQCMKPEAIIIIPIGFYNEPFYKLYDELKLLPFFDFLKSNNLRIDYKHQIYCYLEAVDLKTFLSLSQEFEKNQNTKIIGLFQSSKQDFKLQNGNFFPFDAEFIIFNLLIQSSVNFEEFDQTINNLNQFLNVNYNEILNHQVCECNLIPNQQEIQKTIQNHNLIDEIQQFFNKKQTIQNVYEKFRTAQQNYILDKNFYKEESNFVIQKISQISKVFFQTSKNSNSNLFLYIQYGNNKVENLKAQKQQKNIQYQIKKEDWSNIEDYVADVIDIIVLRSKQGKSQINKEIQFMKDNYHNQIFNNGQNYFNRYLNPIYLETSEPKITIDIQLCVLVMDGLILLIPERKNITPYLVIMTNKLDFESASFIFESIKDNIEKLSKENVEEYSSLLQTIKYKDQDWNTYIVRFNLPQIKFDKL